MVSSSGDAGEIGSDHHDTPREPQPGAKVRPAPCAVDDGDRGSPPSQASERDDSSFRSVVGTGSVQVSDLINSNLIVARYAAYAGIGLLAAYGISHSPVFFRFRTVSDIPPHYFLKRKKLHCRLVGAGESSVTTTSGPVRFRVRHLSMFERYCLFQPSWFEAWMKLHPSTCRPDRNENELLTVELAGIRTPPFLDSNEATSPSIYLHRWARSRPAITLQLLARRKVYRSDAGDRDVVAPGSVSNSASAAHGNQRKKRRIPDHLVATPPTPEGDESADREAALQVVVAKATYRSRATQIGSTDLARYLVQSGRATASSDDGLYPQQKQQQPNPVKAGAATEGWDRGGGSLPPARAETGTGTTGVILDADRSVPTLQRDAEYLSGLASAEYAAARNHEGAWSDPEFRRKHPDVVEEAEFQARAPWWKKAWRWIRSP